MASREAASNICQALRLGVTRSKRRAMQWSRKAAEDGHADSCLYLASAMYADDPNAREIGHVGNAAGVATSAGVMEGHDVPSDVLTGVVHWLLKGSYDPGLGPPDSFRRIAMEGSNYCFNDGCQVLGQPKDFKVCPQCKIARYCATRARKRIGQWVGTR
jgi:TPR repeat protein